MQPDFWQQRWAEQQIGFHQATPTPLLLKHWPALRVPAGATVFVPLAISPMLRKRVPFVVELRNLTYDQQRQIMFFICDRLPRLTGLAFDATGNGGYLAAAAQAESAKSTKADAPARRASSAKPLRARVPVRGVRA